MSVFPPLQLPVAIAAAEIADLAALSPHQLLRDPGLLRIPEASTWTARALKYAKTGASVAYDEIGFRFLAANPWRHRLPLQTRLGMQLERDKEERSMHEAGIETIRTQQPLLAHRPLDLPRRKLDADTTHDGGTLLHVIERLEPPDARPRTDTWVFPLTAPPSAFLENARAADAPLIGSQIHQLNIPGGNWVPLTGLIAAGAFSRMQDWRATLVQRLEPGCFYAFISHRWLSPAHPDPEYGQARFIAWQLVAALCDAVRVAGARGLRQPRRFNDQLRCIVGPAGTDLVESLIVNVLRSTLDDETLAAAVEEVAPLETMVNDAGVAEATVDQRLERLRAILAERPLLQMLVDRVFLWYDYASMPQQPRDETDEAMFRDHLQYLIAIQAVAHTLVLLDDPADYLTRAWCTLEALFASGEVGLCDTLIGSARRTARDGRTEHYFAALLLDHPLVVWRALLDTEVLRMQSPGDCLRRLELSAADSRDIPYIYDRLCRLHAPKATHSDASEIITGVFPVPIVNDGTEALVPRRQGRNVARQVARALPFTVDWSAAIQLESYRRLSPTPLTVNDVPPFTALSPADDDDLACHIAIVASCEAEALMLGRWALDHRDDLFTRYNRAIVVSMSWLAVDVAPVGQIVHGDLVAHAVHARLWAVVAFAGRFDACPATVALTETLRECALPYLEMRVDQTDENVTLIRSPPQSARQPTPDEVGRFTLVSTAANPFSRHVGGLFQADFPQAI